MFHPADNLTALRRRLGNIPPGRICLRPPPGRATDADLLAARHTPPERLCELIDGVLVAKPADFTASVLTACLAAEIGRYVHGLNLGLVTGPSGPLRLRPGLVRLPDISFVSWDRLPGRRRPVAPIPDLAPDLAVEVLSDSNTPEEMALKRQEYFGAGTQLVWEIDPNSRTARVYTAPDTFTALTAADMFDGGAVLPGFTLSLAEVFAELDRQG